LNYESETASLGDITTYYSFSGNIEAKSRALIMSDRNMQIDAILVSEGDVVSEGDKLLDPSFGEIIKAGISGEVAKLYVEENAQVTGGTKLIELVDYEHLQVSVKVDEYDLLAVETGKEVTVKVSSLDKTIKGTIARIAKEGQVINGVTYFMAVIDLEKDDSLKVGMSAEITLQSDQALGVVVLPMAVLQFNSDNTPFVLKRGLEDAVIKTEVTTGINDGVRVEITGGVAADEEILYLTKEAAANSGGFGGRGPMSGNSAGGDN
jgi:HlyD family secretion protein